MSMAAFFCRVMRAGSWRSVDAVVLVDEIDAHGRAPSPDDPAIVRQAADQNMNLVGQRHVFGQLKPQAGDGKVQQRAGDRLAAVAGIEPRAVAALHIDARRLAAVEHFLGLRIALHAKVVAGEN